MDLQVQEINLSCDSLGLEDDWASGLPFDTAKLLLVASEGVENCWSMDDTADLVSKAEPPWEGILQASIATAEFGSNCSTSLPDTAVRALPTLLQSKVQPSVDNNPKSAPICDTVAPTPRALPWERPQRPLCAQHLQAATPGLVAPQVDQAPKACPPVPPLARRPVSAPSCPSTGRPTPRPKSTTGGRQPRCNQANMMAPMMRGRHMDILDEQYLQDHGDRADVGKSKKHSRPMSVRSRAPVAPPNGSGVDDVDAVRCPAPQQRLLGPHAAMPLLKGQAKVRAQMAQREATKEVQEARLKAQFRSRLSSCSRARSEPRSSKHVASGNA